MGDAGKSASNKAASGVQGLRGGVTGLGLMGGAIARRPTAGAPACSVSSLAPPRWASRCFEDSA
jgi:hypothetical protein